MRCSRTWLDPSNESPFSVGRAKRAGQIGGQVLDRYADPPMPDFAMAGQLIHNIARHVDRHGKTDPDIAPTGCKNRSIDTDEPTLKINQRAARVARIYRGVGLNEIFIAFDAKPLATECTDDSRGDRLTEAEGIANCQDKIPDLQTAGIADRDRSQIFGRYPQQCNVGRWIAADQLSCKAPVVLCRDLNSRCVVNDMAVGQDVSMFSVDDDAGSDCFGFSLDRLVAQVKELSKKRILRQRVNFTHLPAHGYPDNARRDPADYAGDARYRCTAGQRDGCATQGRPPAQGCHKRSTRQDERCQFPLHHLENLRV